MTPVSLETITRYADPGRRFTCPWMGIPLDGKTLILPRRLVQAALDAPGIDAAFWDGNGHLHLQGDRFRCKIKSWGRHEMGKGSFGPFNGSYPVLQIHKWAASKRKQVETSRLSPEQRKAQKAQVNLDKLYRKAKRCHYPIFPHLWLRPERVSLSALERDEVLAWYRERPARQKMARLLSGKKAWTDLGDFGWRMGGMTKAGRFRGPSFSVPQKEMRLSDALFGRRLPRYSEIKERPHGGRKQTLEPSDYLHRLCAGFRAKPWDLKPIEQDTLESRRKEIHEYQVGVYQARLMTQEIADAGGQVPEWLKEKRA